MELEFEYVDGVYTTTIESDGKDKVVQIEQEKPYDIRVYANLENMTKTLICTITNTRVNKIFQLSILENVIITIESDSNVINANITENE